MRPAALLPSPPRRYLPLFLGSILVVLSSGCASTHLPPISVEGADFRPQSDEVELWAETRAEEDEILNDFPVVYDPILDDYLQQLLARLAPAGLLANPEIDLQVILLDDPAPLAFAFPHGTILLHTGLLHRTTNEDQLAAVLAREIAHVEGRHMARHQRAVWNRQVGIGVAAFTAAVLLDIEEAEEWEDGDWDEAELLAHASEDVLFAGYELARRVTANGYGRKLDREADESAVRLLRSRGYDPRQGLELYESLHADQQNGTVPIYTSDNLTERIRSLRQSIASPGNLNNQPPLLDDTGFGLIIRPRPPRTGLHNRMD